MKIYLTPALPAYLPSLPTGQAGVRLREAGRPGRRTASGGGPSNFICFSIFFVLLVTNCLDINAQTLVQNFTLTNVMDGKTVSLDQYSSNTALVVVFTSNECPFDNYYKDRIKEMIGAYSGKIQFLLVNSYIEPAESAEKMAIHYTDSNVPYLSDKDQVAMNAFGAKKSPEVFLLKNADGKYAVVYSGAIDDNPQVPKDANQKFLKTAIDKLLAGQKIDVSNNRAVGCSIRRK